MQKITIPDLPESVSITDILLNQYKHDLELIFCDMKAKGELLGLELNENGKYQQQKELKND